MHELALYRKYRPQTFKEVIGQDHIVDVLKSSVENAKVSHAYLFVGSRGTGKTSVARIFAREIGVSENDIYEIDAASNRGIEDIKVLREGARTLPFDSKYKVYIIDEVHMLSKDAWGALLKTLEEPPKHVIFILATTEIHKVPDTIVSRCQMFVFKRPSEAILKNVISQVAKKEGFDLEGSGAELIAILGDGSFRDALGVLQKVLNFSKNKKVKREDIEEITGAPRTSLVNDYIFAIASRDLEAGIKTVREVSAQGLDMKLFAKLLIERFRLVMILKYAPKMEKEMTQEMDEGSFGLLKDLIKSDKDNLLRSNSLSILLESYNDIDHAFISELPLELALIKILNKE